MILGALVWKALSETMESFNNQLIDTSTTESIEELLRKYLSFFVWICFEFPRKQLALHILDVFAEGAFCKKTKGGISFFYILFNPSQEILRKTFRLRAYVILTCLVC